MGRGKAHWRWQTARQRVQSRRDSSWLWWRVHLPLVRSTLRTLAQARLHQSARSIRGPRAPTYVYTGCVFWGWTTCSLALSLFPPLPSPSPAPTPAFRGARFHAFPLGRGLGRGLGRSVWLRLVRSWNGGEGLRRCEGYSARRTDGQ